LTRSARAPRGRLPNALIAGAQKSGTTSLHRGLETHPQIFFPKGKQEIHFFDVAANYARGLDYYAALFSGHGGRPVVAQTSPLYLYEPAVAGRIFEALPEAKLLFILRNPVDRAYSHYWHEVRYGYEKLSFAEALAAEPERLKGDFEARRHWSYLDRGRYAVQLRRYLDLYPEEQIMVCLQDELARDQPRLLRRCAAFLGADSGYSGWVPAGEAGSGAGPVRRHNRARVPRIALLQRMTRGLRKRSRTAAALVDAVNLRPIRYPPMADELRQRLEGELAGEIERLESLIGLDVASRWLPTVRPSAGDRASRGFR